MVPDNGEIATTVGGSAAHNAWVNGSGGGEGAAPATPAPTAPAAAPADPAPAAPATPAPAGKLVEDAPLARPGERASSIKDATKAFLDKHKTTKSAAPAAPASPAASADPAAAAAPAAVAGAVKAGEAAKAAATAAGASPAQAAAAGDKAAEEFLEAQVNGQPFRIPTSAMVPVKVNGKVQLVPIKDVQKGLTMEADYRQKTARLGEDRRSFAAEQARMKAQQEQLEADRKMVEEAQLDPEKWEQYQEHLRQLATNPYYKKNWEAGRSAALDRAELAGYHSADEQSVVQSAAESVEHTLNTLASEYPGVDIASVRAEYANALQQGRAELTEASLRSFFTAEAQRVSRYTGPLTKQIEELKATVDSLAKAKAEETAATTHNEQTRRAIDRDEKGRFTSPAGGTGADISRDPPPKPFTSHELGSRIKSWVDKGRGELRRSG